MTATSTNEASTRWSVFILTLFVCAVVGSASVARGKEARGDMKKLAGKWYVVAEEFKGQPHPLDSLLETKATLTVTGDKFVFETRGPDGGRASHSGTAVLDESARPRHFDWTGTGPKGAALERLGLYELTKAEFTLVYVQRRIKGPPVNRPTVFRTSDGDNHVVVRFQRKPPEAAPPAQPPSAPGTNGRQDLEAIKPLLARFPYQAKAGPVTVYSDISQEFSEVHARNAEKVWTYFSRVFAKTPGEKTVWYYTRDKQLLAAIAKYTPWPVPVLDARVGTAIWNEDHRIWFSVPYQEPDFGSQIHEMSHDFLYATYPQNAEYPWLAEGTGMYWESGRWDPNGDLIVDKALYWHLSQFKEAAVGGELIPVKELLTMKRDGFYKPPVTKAYAQSMVLVHYLMKERPMVMKALFDRLKREEVKNNDELLQVLQKDLRMDLKTLDNAYTQFGLAIEP